MGVFSLILVIRALDQLHYVVMCYVLYLRRFYDFYAAGTLIGQVLGAGRPTAHAQWHSIFGKNKRGKIVRG